MGRVQDANGMECNGIDLASMGQWAIGLALQRTFQTRGANRTKCKKKSTKRNSIATAGNPGNEKKGKWCQLVCLSNEFRLDDTHSMFDSAAVVNGLVVNVHRWVAM